MTYATYLGTYRIRNDYVLHTYRLPQPTYPTSRWWVTRIYPPLLLVLGVVVPYIGLLVTSTFFLLTPERSLPHSINIPIGFDHINRNPPVLIRTPKLTRFEPAQYWGGGPPGNSVVLNPLFFLSFARVVFWLEREREREREIKSYCLKLLWV